MAKIPTLQSPAGIDIPNPPFYPRRFESVPDIGAGAAKGAEIAGRNLATLGGAVQNLGGDVTAIAQQKEAQAAETAVANGRAQTTLDWTTKIEPGLYSGASGGTGQPGLSAPSPGTPGTLQDQAKQAWTTYTASIAKSMPSAKARTAYQAWAAEAGTQVQIKAFDHQQAAQKVQQSSDLTSALDKHTQLVAADPSQYDAAWGAAQQDLQNAAGWEDPAKLAALRATTQHDMQWARADTLSKQQPLAFQREIQPTQYDAASGTGTPYKGFVDNPYYSKLDARELAGFSQGANSAVVDQHNKVLAQQKQVYDQQYNGLMTSLLPGGNGNMSDILKARQDGWLTKYDDIDKAVKAIDQRDKDSMDLAKATALFQTGHTFNPFEEGDKKATDLVYRAEGGADGLIAPPQPGLSAPGTGNANPQAAAAVRLRAFVDKTDIVPQAAVDEIRRGMVSRDANQMMTAFTTMDGLARENPSAANRAFGEADMKRLEQYQQLAPITKPEELVQAMNPSVDLATAKQRAELGAAGKKLIDGELAKGTDYMSDITAHFDQGAPVSAPFSWFLSGSSAKLSGDPYAETSIRADFMANYVRLYSLSGDETSAKAGALAALDRKWGITEVGSMPTIMARPPERAFPRVAGNYHWMDQQAEAMVNQSFSGAQDWTPVTLPQTEGAIGVRQTPSYGLGVHDKDGVWHVLTPPADAKPGWPFDAAAAYQQAIADHEATRGSLISGPPRPGQDRFNAIMNGIRNGIQGPGSGRLLPGDFGDKSNPMGRQTKPVPHFITLPEHIGNVVGGRAPSGDHSIPDGNIEVPSQ